MRQLLHQFNYGSTLSTKSDSQISYISVSEMVLRRVFLLSAMSVTDVALCKVSGSLPCQRPVIFELLTQIQNTFTHNVE